MSYSSRFFKKMPVKSYFLKHINMKSKQSLWKSIVGKKKIIIQIKFN